jgi:G:T/U-mismatch repair DNA glycosylase
MALDLWEPDVPVVFVGTVVTALEDKLGFLHCHVKDRFWDLLQMASIAPGLVLTPQERKALTEGHAQGSVADPIRVLFYEKKISQIRRLGVGLTVLNRRVVAESEKDREARPVDDDVRELATRSGGLHPKILAFTMHPDLFAGTFRKLFPVSTDVPGRQPFTLGEAEVWLLGSTMSSPRAEALERQENAWFEFGERAAAVREST